MVITWRGTLVRRSCWPDQCANDPRTPPGRHDRALHGSVPARRGAMLQAVDPEHPRKLRKPPSADARRSSLNCTRVAGDSHDAGRAASETSMARLASGAAIRIAWDLWIVAATPQLVTPCAANRRQPRSQGGHRNGACRWRNWPPNSRRRPIGYGTTAELLFRQSGG
jgi:hypothetical protein